MSLQYKGESRHKSFDNNQSNKVPMQQDQQKQEKGIACLEQAINKMTTIIGQNDLFQDSQQLLRESTMQLEQLQQKFQNVLSISENEQKLVDILKQKNDQLKINYAQDLKDHEETISSAKQELFRLACLIQEAMNMKNTYEQSQEALQAQQRQLEQQLMMLQQDLININQESNQCLVIKMQTEQQIIELQEKTNIARETQQRKAQTIAELQERFNAGGQELLDLKKECQQLFKRWEDLRERQLRLSLHLDKVVGNLEKFQISDATSEMKRVQNCKKKLEELEKLQKSIDKEIELKNQQLQIMRTTNKNLECKINKLESYPQQNIAEEIRGRALLQEYNRYQMLSGQNQLQINNQQLGLASRRRSNPSGQNSLYQKSPDNKQIDLSKLKSEQTERQIMIDEFERILKEKVTRIDSQFQEKQLLKEQFQIIIDQNNVFIKEQKKKTEKKQKSPFVLDNQNKQFQSTGYFQDFINNDNDEGNSKNKNQNQRKYQSQDVHYINNSDELVTFSENDNNFNEQNINKQFQLLNQDNHVDQEMEQDFLKNHNSTEEQQDKAQIFYQDYEDDGDDQNNLIAQNEAQQQQSQSDEQKNEKQANLGKNITQLIDNLKKMNQNIQNMDSNIQNQSELQNAQK